MWGISKQTVGVDIGHSSVKVVGIDLGKKIPQLIGFKEVAVDPKYLQKEGFDHLEVIAQALSEACKTAIPKPIYAKLAFASVSESLVFRKILELPVIPDPDELWQAILSESAQYLPNSVEDMEVDFQQLGKVSQDGIQQIMVVAVPKKIIQDYISIFNLAKLPIGAIDSKPAALGRAVISYKEKAAIILVDIGSEISTISLYDEQIIQVADTINTGGNSVRSKEDANSVEDDKLNEKIKRLSLEIQDEIEHVIKFYANRSLEQKKVQEVRVSGGGSMIPGVIEQLGSEIELPVVAAKSIISLPPFCDRRYFGALGSAFYPLYDLEKRNEAN